MKFFQSTASRGRQGEDSALDFLLDKGMRLIERNYLCRLGEIDLIMHDKDAIVFVEVRYRSSQAFGGAINSVDQRKQAKLIKCAQHFIANCLEKKLTEPSFRFDVIAISPVQSNDGIQWIINAFDEF
ncbi:MAG: hypothetical protein A6F71_02790 [Cycloclasticus sp. symbiont of Poecilosclerida sp. M]|nr:MAG: hypothetical protein A6F71_02790 [Cycloclasticus sp. symbiont of Poecilosclerida sp. M]